MNSTNNLPALPEVENAPLPVRYEAARAALAECYRVDECKDWADKAVAMASYARQAKNSELFKTATRIQSRAMRRCGELLSEFDGRGGDRTKTDAADSSAPSQREAAEQAGMSERQQVTAVRVANVPAEEFEAAVESSEPPTVTALAERGKVSRTTPEQAAAVRRSTGILFQLADSLKRIATMPCRPEEYREHCPPYCRHLIDERLDEAFEWLEQFQKVWRSQNERDAKTQ